MVPVHDVLRHITERIGQQADHDTTLIRFLADMQEGRLKLFHPASPLLCSPVGLPGVAADHLFLVGYDHKQQKYVGRFYWFTADARTIKDCQRIQQRLNELMEQPGWAPFVGELDQLPWPSSRLIGGLLVCRNGDNWITLALTPTSIAPSVTLLHLIQAIPVVLVDLFIHPEEVAMGQAHPMIDLALKGVGQIRDPRRRMLLATCCEELRRRHLHIVGAMPGEEAAFFSPENNLQVVFMFATQLYREGDHERIDFWSAWEEFDRDDETLSHVVEDRLLRFIKRRRSIYADRDLLSWRSTFSVTESPVHAAWVITQDPHDSPQTRLLVVRGLDQNIGVACLEEAIYRAYIWH